MGRRWEDYELEMIRKVPRGELRKVAQQIGRSYAAVCLKRTKAKISPRRPPAWTWSELEWVVSRRILGASYREISRELGRSESALSSAMFLRNQRRRTRK